MMQEFGTPFTGRKLERLKAFLREGGLEYDDGVTFTVNLLDDAFGIMATGSLQDNTIKCLLVGERYQGEGLTGTLLTHLVNHAVQTGRQHLFLFTAPHNQLMFADFGFYEVARTADVLLMENRRHGIRDFVVSLECPVKTGEIGAIVMNCNPFTLGHLYLIETAAKQCDLVHVFILSEDKSAFPAASRLEMVRSGVAHLPNVVVHPTADYLISSATFPTYFMKDQADASQVNCTLDFTIFRDCFAAPMGIRKRFVGTEPFCAVTNAYNRQMKVFFRGSGIEIVEIPRHTLGDTQVSASQVRRLLSRGREQEAFQLVPDSTRRFLQSRAGKEVIAKLGAVLKIQIL